MRVEYKYRCSPNTSPLDCISAHFLTQHRCRCSCHGNRWPGSYHLSKQNQASSYLDIVKLRMMCQSGGILCRVILNMQRPVAHYLVHISEQTAARFHPCALWRDPWSPCREPTTCRTSNKHFHILVLIPVILIMIGVSALFSFVIVGAASYHTL